MVASGPLAASYAACERLARGHYENFPVASRLLPKAMRPHVAAVYAFARAADDVADEPGRQPSERIALLNAYRQRLMQGTKRSKDSGYRLPDPVTAEFFPALFDTINRTWLSKLVIVILGEIVLRLGPRGTHDPALFIRPEELTAGLERHELAMAGTLGGIGPRGLDRRLDVTFGSWPTTAITYIGCARG